MRTRRPRPAATRSAFAGFHFPSDVIVLAVRWYLRFGLPCRDVEELLAVRPMRGLKQDRSARVIIAGLAFVQNLRRDHYELA